MPYILLNYYENEGRETACRPAMKSEHPTPKINIID